VLYIELRKKEMEVLTITSPSTQSLYRQMYSAQTLVLTIKNDSGQILIIKNHLF